MANGSCCMQAFAISVKGRVRPGRFRSNPKDVTACRYDMAPKLLKASTHALCSILLPVPILSAAIVKALPGGDSGQFAKPCRGPRAG